MPYIEVDKERLSFPPNLQKMPIKKGIDLAILLRQREEMEDMKERELMEWAGEYIKTLTDCSDEVLKKIPLPSAMEIIETIQTVWGVYEPDKDRRYVEIGMVKYHFPRAGKLPLEKTTYGEWMDAQKFEKLHEDMQGGDLQAALKIMAIYCRPATMMSKIRRSLFRTRKTEWLDLELWDNDKYYERLELFEKHLSFADLLDFAFFLDSQNRLSIKAILSSQVGLAKEMLGRLANDMDGTED